MQHTTLPPSGTTDGTGDGCYLFGGEFALFHFDSGSIPHLWYRSQTSWTYPATAKWSPPIPLMSRDGSRQDRAGKHSQSRPTPREIHVPLPQDLLFCHSALSSNERFHNPKGKSLKKLWHSPGHSSAYVKNTK